MQALIQVGPRLAARGMTRLVLQLSLGLSLMLLACAVPTWAQMRPMRNVTVGQPDKSPERESAAAIPEKPAKEIQAREPATRNAAAARPETPRATAAPRQTQAPAAERTRARRVVTMQASSAPAGTRDDAREESSDARASDASMTRAKSSVVVRIDEEAPPMAVAAPEAKEATPADRTALLRAQIQDAVDDKERARLRRSLVDQLVSLDRKQEAVAELRSMMREERFDPIGFYNTGNALARLGDAETAIDAYRKAISQRHGNYARALNNLGVLLLREGRWDEAQDALTNALRQENFRYAEASYNLGRLYAARGEAGLAMAEWTRTLSLQPDHLDAALALARAYAEDGSQERALLVLDQFTGRNVPSPEITAARQRIAALVAEPGKLALKAGGENVSGAGAASALSLDARAYEFLQSARAAREAGRYEESVGYYRRVLAARNGFFPPANLEMSYSLINLKRFNEAIAALGALTAKDGAHYPAAYYHLARLYEGQDQLSLAEQAYKEAAAIYGESNPQPLLDLSRVREREGNIVGALSALESYLRISERRGQRPEWAVEKVANLRQKLAALPAQAGAPKQ